MKQLKRSKSLSEKALEGLREAIITGQFKLGEHLSEVKLASSIGISKTPVREALKRLRTEGLVTVVPQSGTFVFTLSAREVIKMCELRFLLEMAAFKFSYQRNREEFTEALQAVVDKMTAAQIAGDIPKYLHLDNKFHEQLFNYCGNQYIADAYSLIGGKIAALRTHLSSLPQHTQLSFKEHQEFVGAISQKDLDKATIVLEKHIGRSKETYAENIQDISMANRSGLQKGGK